MAVDFVSDSKTLQFSLSIDQSILDGRNGEGKELEFVMMNKLLTQCVGKFAVTFNHTSQNGDSIKDEPGTPDKQQSPSLKRSTSSIQSNHERTFIKAKRARQIDHINNILINSSTNNSNVQSLSEKTDESQNEVLDVSSRRLNGSSLLAPPLNLSPNSIFDDGALSSTDEDHDTFVSESSTQRTDDSEPASIPQSLQSDASTAELPLQSGDSFLESLYSRGDTTVVVSAPADGKSFLELSNQWKKEWKTQHQDASSCGDSEDGILDASIGHQLLQFGGLQPSPSGGGGGDTATFTHNGIFTFNGNHTRSPRGSKKKFSRGLPAIQEGSMLKCSLCDFTTKYQGSLGNHIINIHSVLKPFTCDMCSYSSKQKGNLKAHYISCHKLPVESADKLLCVHKPQRTQQIQSAVGHLPSFTQADGGGGGGGQS